jgi:hypothetical protein
VDVTNRTLYGSDGSTPLIEWDYLSRVRFRNAYTFPSGPPGGDGQVMISGGEGAQDLAWSGVPVLLSGGWYDTDQANVTLSGFNNDSGFIIGADVPDNETDPIVGAITGLVKADGNGAISAAVAGTDYIETEADPIFVAWAPYTNWPGDNSGALTNDGNGVLTWVEYITDEVDPVFLQWGPYQNWPANAAGALTNDGAGNLSWVEYLTPGEWYDDTQGNINISGFNNDSGFITGITSQDVTDALGYTPYSDANPDGYFNSSSFSAFVTDINFGNQTYNTANAIINVEAV